MKIKSAAHNIRLDQYLATHSPYSRSKILKMVKQGYVLINNEKKKSSYKVRLGDLIEIKDGYQKKSKVKGVNLNLDIIFEDDYVLVINKPKGLPVHPSKGHTISLMNGLIHYFESNNLGTPGLVHRLDIDTSGLLVIAKNEEVHEFLVHNILEKKYVMVVDGQLKQERLVEKPIGVNPASPKQFIVDGEDAKYAKTLFTPLAWSINYSLVEATLFTGRTHQIRVHAAYLNLYLHEDKLYNNGTLGQFLCAYKLSFIHPSTLKTIHFSLPIPWDIYTLEKEA